MKKSQIKSGIILSYIQTGLNAVISLVYTPIMLRLLGQSEYGVYTLASSVIAYLGLLNFGLSSSYVRFYTRYKEKDDWQGLAQLNYVFFIVYLIIAVVAFVAGVSISFHVDVLFGEKFTQAELDTTRVLMIVLSFNLMMTFLSTTFTAYVSANERFIFQKILTMGKTVLSPLVTIPVLLFGFRSIGLAIVTTVISLSVDCSNVVFCFWKLHMKFSEKRADFRLLGEIGSYSVFIAINCVVDQINWQVDKIVLGHYRGALETAVYGVASQINTLYISMSTSISSVFVPRIHRIAVSKKPDWQFTQLLTKVGRIQLLVLGLVGSGLALFGAEFIKVWAGAEYADAYPIVLLLALPGTIPLIQNLGIEIQRAKNMHKFRSAAYACMALVNVVISIVLGKRYGGVGCAIGTAISIVLANGFVMNWYYYRKMNIDIKFFWKQIVSMLPTILAIAFVYGILLHFVLKPGLVGMALGMVVYVFLYFICCWLFVMNNEEKRVVSDMVKHLMGRCV